MKKKFFGEDHFSTAIVILQLSRTFNALGKKEMAYTFAKDAFDIGKKALTEEHTFTTACMNNLGDLLSERGEFSAADSLYKMAININTKLVGEQHSRTITSVLGYSKVLINSNRFAQAEKILLENLEIQKNNSANNLGLERLNKSLAELYELWGKPELAKIYLNSDK